MPRAAERPTEGARRLADLHRLAKVLQQAAGLPGVLIHVGNAGIGTGVFDVLQVHHRPGKAQRQMVPPRGRQDRRQGGDLARACLPVVLGAQESNLFADGHAVGVVIDAVALLDIGGVVPHQGRPLPRPPHHRLRQAGRPALALACPHVGKPHQRHHGHLAAVAGEPQAQAIPFLQLHPRGPTLEHQQQRAVLVLRPRGRRLAEPDDQPRLRQFGPVDGGRSPMDLHAGSGGDGQIAEAGVHGPSWGLTLRIAATTCPPPQPLPPG